MLKQIGNYAIETFIGYGASSAVFKGYDLKCRNHGVSKNVAIKFIWDQDMALDEVRRLEKTQPVFGICDLITYDEVSGARVRELIGDTVDQLQRAMGSALPIWDDQPVGVLILKLISGEHLIDRGIYHGEELDPSYEWTVDFSQDDEDEQIVLKEWLTPVARKMNIEQRLEVLLQLVKAIHESHKRGVVHGDLNPWNVFYLEETERISLIDLGRNNFGVQGWRSPEHDKLMADEIDNLPPETDIRLLGQWMKLMLPRKGPWSGLIDKCYRKDPAQRPTTRDLLKAIKGYSAPQPKRRFLAAAIMFSTLLLVSIYAWQQHTPFSLETDHQNRIAVLPYEGSATSRLVAEMVAKSLDATDDLEAVEYGKARDAMATLRSEKRSRDEVFRMAADSLGSRFVLSGTIEEGENSTLIWTGSLYQKEGAVRRLTASGRNPLALADAISNVVLSLLGSTNLPLPASAFYSTDLNANFVFSYGNDFLFEGNYNAAIPLYRKALDYDRNFLWAKAKLGKCLYHGGDIGGAKALLDEVVENPEAAHQPRLMIYAYQSLISIYHSNLDSDSAQRMLFLAKDLAERYQLKEYLAGLLVHEAVIYHSQDREDEARATLQRAEEAYDQLNDQIGRLGETLVQINLDLGQKKIAEATAKIQSARRVARIYGLENYEAMLLVKSAQVDFLRPSDQVTRETHDKLERARAIQSRIGDEHQKLDTLFSIALYHQNRNDLGKARSGALEVLNQAVRVGDFNLEVKATLLLADLAHMTGRLDEAEYFLRPLLSKKTSDSRIVLLIYSRLWNIFAQRGQYEEAEAVLHKHLDMARRTKNRTKVANGLNNLGELQEMQGHYEEALAYYEDALPRKRRLGGIKGLTWTLRNMVMVSIKMGRLDRARAYMAQLDQVDPGEFQTRVVLARLQYEQGHYRQALETLEQIRTVVQERDRWHANLEKLHELYQRSVELDRPLELPNQFGNWF